MYPELWGSARLWRCYHGLLPDHYSAMYQFLSLSCTIDGLLQLNFLQCVLPLNGWFHVLAARLYVGFFHRVLHVLLILCVLTSCVMFVISLVYTSFVCCFYGLLRRSIPALSKQNHCPFLFAFEILRQGLICYYHHRLGHGTSQPVTRQKLCCSLFA